MYLRTGFWVLFCLLVPVLTLALDAPFCGLSLEPPNVWFGPVVLFIQSFVHFFLRAFFRLLVDWR